MTRPAYFIRYIKKNSDGSKTYYWDDGSAYVNIKDNRSPAIASFTMPDGSTTEQVKARLKEESDKAYSMRVELEELNK